jgi:hypothetical protein
MKKTSKKKSPNAEMQPEYDFAGKKGERGKYFQAYREGHQVRIRQADGTVDVQYYSLKDGAIMLEPDVRRYFPDSDSVNNALRTLIGLIPGKTTKQPKAKSR